MIEEVLSIKAKSPELSRRLIAYVFNTRFAYKNESVGKTFVSYTLKNNFYRIQVLRKQWKNKKPYQVLFNRYWAMDMTFINQQPVLGITEHHSRLLLGLIPLKDKSSLNIIKKLMRLLRIYRKPTVIRTDNEACFNSRIIRLFLKFLGIKHQTIEKYCPWQNGRVERLFGTFKVAIAGMPIAKQELPLVCYHFQQWYNVIRPHQSLNNQTPEEAYWEQIKKLYEK